MLNIERQIFNFAENYLFKKSLPKECILDSINSCMRECKTSCRYSHYTSSNVN